MLILRLQRLGKCKQPVYRLIVSEKKRDTQYGQLEILGSYNTSIKENRFTVKADRVKYWLSVGAQMSATVNNLLISNKIIEGKKKQSVKISKKRAKKIEEKKKTVAEAKAKAEAPAPVAPAPVEPTPVETTPAA